MPQAQQLRLLTQQQVSQITGWSRGTLRRLRQEAGLPYIKVGRSVRIAESDLLAFLEAHRRATYSMGVPDARKGRRGRTP